MKYKGIIMIRQINENEILQCVEVIRKSFKTIAQEFNITVKNSPKYVLYSVDENKLLNQFNSGKNMFAYFIDDKIVGYYSLSINGDECEINNLCVLPEYRHRDIGKELLFHAMDFVKSADIRKINISIVEENSRLKKWYSDFGFVHRGTEKFSFFSFTCGYMEMNL